MLNFDPMQCGRHTCMPLQARELWISKFPSIVYFRNGEEVKYRGEITNPKAVYNWLTSEKTLNLPNRYIEITTPMFGAWVSVGLNHEPMRAESSHATSHTKRSW